MSDGMLLDGDKHRSLQALIKKRKGRIHQQRDYYARTKEIQNKKRMERKKQNEAQENERRKDWYYRNHEREKFNEIQRRIKRYPHRFINHAISEYRSNRITLDELNRRVNQAIEQADGLDHKTGNKRRESI
jgi:hypothetical protein